MVARRLDGSGMWHRTSDPKQDKTIRDLDALTKAAFFDVKPNGFLYRHLAVEIPAHLQWPQTDPALTVRMPIPANGVELFLNPQGSGVVSLSLHWNEKTSGLDITALRCFLYQLGQTDLNEDSSDQTVPVQWSRKLRECILEWTEPLRLEDSFQWLRRFLVVGARFGDDVGPFPLAHSNPQAVEVETMMWALAAALRPDMRVLPMPGVQLAALNPFHMAGVFESGAAHIVVDSPETEKHNEKRISWVQGTYSLLTIHEILYRNAAVNLIREARYVAELPADSEETAELTSKSRLEGGSRGQAVTELSRRLIEFQLYADVTRAGPSQAIRTYYRMASAALGGQESLVRLRQAVTALEQVEVAQRTATSAEKMVELQKKVELLEVFIFGYYLIAVTHYVFHAFHIPESFTGGAYLIMAGVGAVSAFLDSGLRNHVFGHGWFGWWTSRPFWILIAPILVFAILFWLGLTSVH